MPDFRQQLLLEDAILPDSAALCDMSPPLVFTIVRLPYPVVIINWVQYLEPPGPFSFPDSRDLLEVLGGLPWQRESP